MIVATMKEKGKGKEKRKTEKSKCLVWTQKTRTLHCWWECKMVQLLWKTAWQVLRKLNIELPYVSAIPLQPKGGNDSNVHQWKNE
jgi:hypothetical protein